MPDITVIYPWVCLGLFLLATVLCFIAENRLHRDLTAKRSAAAPARPATRAEYRVATRASRHAASKARVRFDA